jgi:cyclopropane-fatty-acyl-phospholipid synthase
LNTAESLELQERAPWSARAIFKLLSSLRVGCLDLVTPDGVRRRFAGAPGPHAELRIHDWKAIGQMARRAEIGLFEATRDGVVETPDMVALLRLFVLNAEALESVFYGGTVSALLLRLAHMLRANTRAGARRNIRAHYDLGNDFYAAWLDPGMTYSSALFAGDNGRSLVEAQDAKYDRLLDLLEVQPGHEVLEIGCGWGGLAERAARRGCRVTGLTLSHSQLHYAQTRMRAAGVADQVDLRLCDYRDVRGSYDRIVSIEMVEAVGERYWPAYFRTLHDRLKPGGRAGVQAIVIADAAFERYRRSSDFIREYVFPGGMLPSVARFEAEARAQGLRMEAPYRFGRDYAETLRRWRQSFDAAEARVRAQGYDDDFIAAWRFYLDYCEAGFDTGRVDVIQVELARCG